MSNTRQESNLAERLPELPEPASCDPGRFGAIYTADQMREYAARAIREAGADGARYAELKRRYAAVDFHYGEPPGCVLVFGMPPDVRVTANLDDTIDRLIADQEPTP